MLELVNLYTQPKLKSPSMIASWPSIGGVSNIAANYLLSKLDFKELGKLEASYFYSPTGVTVKDNVVEAPNFPQSNFYYYTTEGENDDILLFIGDDQTTVKGYELVNTIIDVGQHFQVQRVYTFAAALTRIHHTEQPRVWGVSSSPSLVDLLTQYDLKQKGNLQIAGLNGLLLGAAKEKGVDGLCLLGEVPIHTNRMQNPMAALAILQVWQRIMNINIDFSELEQIASEASNEMKELASDAMGKYINLFTESIWEEGKEYEEDEEL